MKNIIRILLIGVMILSLPGCVEEEEEKTGEKSPTTTSVLGNAEETKEPVPVKERNIVSKIHYGNWVYIADGTEEKIDKNFNHKIKSLGKNFIEVTKEEKKYILLRDGSPNGVVRGKLYTDIKHVQKLDRESEQKITHYIPIFKTSKNTQKYKVTIDDGFFKQTKVVSANGEFSFSGVTTGNVRIKIGKIDIGDIEEIIEDEDASEAVVVESEGIEEDTSQEIEQESNEETIFNEILPIKDEDKNLGNFAIPDKDDKYNFKTTKVIDTQDEDDRYMYESRTFSGKLSFINTGEEIASGLNYEITTSDPYVEELTHEIVMGSVEAGQSVEIPFEVTFGRLDKIAHRVKLDFLIRDVNRQEWLDHVYLDVYQTPVTVNLKTKTSNLKGYFITPEHEIINIDTKDIKVKIPSRPDSSYYFLVTSPLDVGAETAYSFGIDVNASDFEDFHDTSAYEPNNLEEKATKLQIGDSIKSFIHKGDIDFYTIDFQEKLSFEPPRLPFN